MPKGVYIRTEEGRANMAAAQQLVAQRPEWREGVSRGWRKPGDPAWNALPWEQKSYSGRHKWVQANFTCPGACEECGSDQRLEWANVDHAYRQDRADWRRLCHTCHVHADDRLPPPGGGR